MLFGYIVIVPLAEFLFGDDEDEEEHSNESIGRDAGRGETEDPLETLRNRYARGELTEEEFEEKLDRLLETETIDDVAARRGRETLRDTETE